MLGSGSDFYKHFFQIISPDDFWQTAPHEAKQYHTYFVFWLKKEISEVQSELEIKILVANYALMSNVLLRKILRGMYIFYDFISFVNSDILKAFSRRLNK